MEKNKYNKTLKYRNHPNLKDDFWMPYFVKIFIYSGIAYFVLYFMGFRLGGYPIIRSMGFANLISLVLYKSWIRPAIYRGAIKAYYRRSYAKVSEMNEDFLTAAIAFTSIFIIQVGLDIKNGIFLTHTLKASTDPFGLLIGFAMLLAMLYWTFFEDKYVSIKEFSDRINYQMKFNGKSFGEAFSIFYKEKDAEYDVKEFDGTLFDSSQVLPNGEAKKPAAKKENLIRREMREDNERN